MFKYNDVENNFFVPTIMLCVILFPFLWLKLSPVGFGIEGLKITIANKKLVFFPLILLDTSFYVPNLLFAR